MDIQPLAKEEAEKNEITEPISRKEVTSSVANIPEPVYPTPTIGAATSTPSSIAAHPNQFSSHPSIGSQARLAVALSAAAVAVIPLVIFVPSLIGSMTKVTIWVVIVAVLSIAGLAQGAKAQSQSSQVDTMGLIAMVISTVMLINCLIIGSYYAKLQLSLNSFRQKYDTLNSL